MDQILNTNIDMVGDSERLRKHNEIHMTYIVLLNTYLELAKVSHNLSTVMFKMYVSKITNGMKAASKNREITAAQKKYEINMLANRLLKLEKQEMVKKSVMNDVLKKKTEELKAENVKVFERVSPFFERQINKKCKFFNS